MDGAGDTQPGVRVGLFFGQHLIRTWAATPEQAAAYAVVVRRELRGMRVATSPLPADERCEPLPAPHWWLLETV